MASIGATISNVTCVPASGVVATGETVQIGFALTNTGAFPIHTMTAYIASGTTANAFINAAGIYNATGTLNTGRSNTFSFSAAMPAPSSGAPHHISGLKLRVLIATNAGNPAGGDDVMGEAMADLPFTALDLRYRPSISTFCAQRCTADGSASDTGTYVKFDVRCALAEGADASNTTLTLAWKPSTQTAYADENAVGITPEDAIAGISGSILFPQTAFSIADAFDFRLAFTDGYDAATGMAGVKKAFANLHLAGCGKGVGIGQYASNDGENPKFECAYPAYVYGDLTVSGVTHGLQAMVVAKDENFAGASGPGAAYARLIPFDTVKLSAGTALSFDAGACGIRIGAGVSYVRARASVSFTTGFTANQAITRMVYILCNDTIVCDYFTILPGVANLYTRLNSDEVLFPVSEGDVICAKCGSYSGNAGVMNLAVLTVEAVG